MQPEPLIEQYVAWIRDHMDRPALLNALESLGFSQTAEDSDEELVLALADFCVTARLDPADPEVQRGWGSLSDGTPAVRH
jgi:hypothetical protein